MFNPKENTNVALNKVTINGYEVGYVNDEEAKKLHSIVRAMMNGTSVVSTPTTTTKSSNRQPDSSSKDDSFVQLEDDKAYSIGFVSVYPSHKAVRYWESIPCKKSEKRDKIYYAIKKSLTDNGAKWSKEKSAFEFSKKTDFDKWVKAQKERSTK